MGSNKEKSNIAMAILEKLPIFKRVTQIILHFDGSNNIRVDWKSPGKIVRKIFIAETKP